MYRGSRMNRRALIAAGIAAPMLASCAWMAKGHKFRFRLKLVAQIDGIEYEGSSVIQVRWYDNQFVANPGPLLQTQITGEAVILELGATRGPIFALLERPPHRGYLQRMLMDVLSRHVSEAWQAGEREGESSWDYFERLSEVRQEVVLPESEWPMLVRFRDIRDPATVEAVDPHYLAGGRADGAAISSVTLQLTKDRREMLVEKRLPWLKSIGTHQFDGRVGIWNRSPNFANLLDADCFIREGY